MGLPNTVLDVPGRLVLDWARRAEERGFSSLATIDRIAYPSYDSLTVRTAAAAGTERIGLLTNILLGPAYNPVQLAKVTASRDRIPLLIGGQPDLAAPRAARWAAGFTIGGAPPEMAGGAIEGFRKAYAEAGGTGQPRIVALSYFSLGGEHTAESLHNLRSYYGFLGDWAEGVASGASRTPAAVREVAAAFEEVGVDE